MGGGLDKEPSLTDPRFEPMGRSQGLPIIIGAPSWEMDPRGVEDRDEDSDVTMGLFSWLGGVVSSTLSYL